MPIQRHELTAFFDELLQPQGFPDYGPNGLQIEGGTTVERIAFAVSATVRSAEAAVAAGAQALVVHHGLFWRFHGARPLTGLFARRVFPLVRHGVNLYGYHLPLDAHLEVGNAAAIARRLGMAAWTPFGDYQGVATGVQGELPESWEAAGLQRRLETLLNHPVLLASPDPAAPIRTLGIITGGANGEWRQALAAGLDAYLTGEMSEHDWHESQEAGMHMFAGGHHATEQFGIQDLMARVQEALDVECLYLPCDNPA